MPLFSLKSLGMRKESRENNPGEYGGGGLYCIVQVCNIVMQTQGTVTPGIRNWQGRMLCCPSGVDRAVCLDG